MTTSATLNTLPVLPAGRTPRGALKLNGTIVPWLSLSVDNNGFNQADTFEVKVSAAALPKTFSGAALTALTEIDLEVFFGLPMNPTSYSINDLTSYMAGRVDDYEYDPLQNVISFKGRDLSALLIDSKSTEKWPNKRSSDIATALAAKYGLTPVVTTTSTFAGTFYQIDKVDMTDQRSDWDLLTYLADKEQFAVYVQGHSLHFEPKAQNPTPYLIKWTPPQPGKASPVSNVKSISLTRNLVVGQGVTVYVRSWNAKSKKAFTVNYPKSTHNVRPTTATLPAGTQVVNITVPNKTQDECLQIAIARYNSIVQHEMKLTAELPGDNILNCRATVRVDGTGTAFDQIYYPDSVKRTMSFDGGYAMSVTAKNLAPNSAPVL